MLIIAGTIRIEKPATEEVLEACRNMMEATHQEDVCIDYVFSVDPIDPKVLHVFERWETQEALDNHFLTSHMTPFREAMANWGVNDMDILKFDVGSFERMRELRLDKGPTSVNYKVLTSYITGGTTS